MALKDYVCTAFGVIGSAIVALFGGWTTGMATLLIFMAIDYFSGLIVAGVFKKSKKTDSGTLESRAGWKGLIRKGMVLLIVLVGHQLDLMLNSTYIRDAVCIAFVINELISIVENAGLMGITIPPIISKAIEILKTKEENTNDLGK